MVMSRPGNLKQEHTDYGRLDGEFLLPLEELTDILLMRLSSQLKPKCSSLVTVNICISRNFRILHHSHEEYTDIF
jgi:hypothetical protein